MCVAVACVWLTGIRLFVSVERTAPLPMPLGGAVVTGAIVSALVITILFTIAFGWRK
jgi:hypothetical protein